VKFLGVVMLPLLVLLTGCGSGSTASAPSDAVMRVLKTRQEHVTKRNEALVAAPTPSAASVIVGRFCSNLGQVDLSGCPKDFEDAFREHVRRCSAIPAALNQLPTTTPPQAVLNLLSGVPTEVEGAAPLTEAVKIAGDTWLAAKSLGLRYAPVAYMLEYPAQAGDPTLEYWNALHRLFLSTRLPIKPDDPGIVRIQSEGRIKGVVDAILGLTTDGVDPELIAWAQRVVVSLREESSFGSLTSIGTNLSDPSNLRRTESERWKMERDQLREEGHALQLKLGEKCHRPFPACGL
jgi:hypothetical protein